MSIDVLGVIFENSKDLFKLFNINMKKLHEDKLR